MSFIGESFFQDLGRPPGARYLYGLGQLCDIAYFADPSFLDRWAAFMGFQNAHTEITPGVELPNYVKALHDDGCLFAIAGTTDWRQMLQNVGYSGQRENVNFGEGFVHSFFLWVAEGLLPYIRADLASRPPPRKISFTGHSLGAAAAYLLACWFDKSSAYTVENFVGFCSPRVGDPFFTHRPRNFR